MMFLFGKKRKEEESKQSDTVEKNEGTKSVSVLTDNDEAVERLASRPTYTFDMETKTFEKDGVGVSKVELTEEQLAEQEKVSKEAYEFDVVAYVKRHRQPFEQIRLHNRKEMRALFNEGVKIKKIRLPENISMFYDDTYEFADDEDYTLGGRIKNVLGHEYFWVGTALFFADDGVTPVDMTEDLLDVVKGQLLGVYAELEEDISASDSETVDANNGESAESTGVANETDSKSIEDASDDTAGDTGTDGNCSVEGAAEVENVNNNCAGDTDTVGANDTEAESVNNICAGDVETVDANDTEVSKIVESSFEDSDSTESEVAAGVFDTVEG